MSTRRVLRSVTTIADLLWLYCLKRAVWVAIISFMVSSIGLSLSNSDVMPMDTEDNQSNGTGIFPPCPINATCETLPGHCIECDFNYNCTYGETREVTCSPRDPVECKHGNGTVNFNHSFNRSFECQYCYQLPENDTCCTTNTNCNVRGTPSSLYIANCTAKDEVLCLLPRNFTKQLRCNYSNGKRWTSAFLLSFTLGGFGIDRFYLNHWGSACGKLISFGGLGVWSILDVILIGTGYLGPADGSAYIY